MGKWSNANCMGYALGINRWLLVEDWRYRNIEDMTQELVEHYNLKVVKRSEMVLGKTYIAFRVSREDFHFMKRGKDGHWRHKPGWNYVRSIREKDVFANQWRSGMLYYNSRVVLFEVQD